MLTVHKAVQVLFYIFNYGANTYTFYVTYTHH